MYLLLFPSVRKMEIHEDTRQMVTFTFSANEITVSFFSSSNKLILLKLACQFI